MAFKAYSTVLVIEKKNLPSVSDNEFVVLNKIKKYSTHANKDICTLLE